MALQTKAQRSNAQRLSVARAASKQTSQGAPELKLQTQSSESTRLSALDIQEQSLLRTVASAAAGYRAAVQKLLRTEFEWREFAAKADPGDAAHEDHMNRMRSAKTAYAGADYTLSTAQNALARFTGDISPNRPCSRKRVISALRNKIASMEAGASA